MADGRTTSVELVQALQRRIQALNKKGPRLNAVLWLNPEAVEDAKRLDADRRRGDVWGPLHGIPMLFKANIAIAGQPITAGALALCDSFPPGDALLVQRLRKSGVVILGITNMTEFANFVSPDVEHGYSAVRGYVRNAYGKELTPDGSSSGSAVAAAVHGVPTVGTETQGSIAYPAELSSCVGLKPTVGLVPRTGILPLSGNQDTPGPITRTTWAGRRSARSG
ncbi:amidase family protein [Nocardia sp. 2YAB30]|uniref:amidase family protein n=1 Tax=Nocardia sp. 2YAB30 TaxID=3233022 RepID=UPI003F969141